MSVFRGQMPSPAAALRVKISPMRMYRASISADLWPVWRMMSRSLTPFIATWVRPPKRQRLPVRSVHVAAQARTSWGDARTGYPFRAVTPARHQSWFPDLRNVGRVGPEEHIDRLSPICAFEFKITYAACILFVFINIRSRSALFVSYL